MQLSPKLHNTMNKFNDSGDEWARNTLEEKS